MWNIHTGVCHVHPFCLSGDCYGTSTLVPQMPGRHKGTHMGVYHFHTAVHHPVCLFGDCYSTILQYFCYNSTKRHENTRAPTWACVISTPACVTPCAFQPICYKSFFVVLLLQYCQTPERHEGTHMSVRLFHTSVCQPVCLFCQFVQYCATILLLQSSVTIVKHQKNTRTPTNACVAPANVAWRHTWLCACPLGLLAMYSIEKRINNHSTTKNSAKYSKYTTTHTQNRKTKANKSP